MATYAEISAQMNQSVADADREAKVLEVVRKLQALGSMSDLNEGEPLAMIQALSTFISDPRVTNEVNRILND